MTAAKTTTDPRRMTADEKALVRGMIRQECERARAALAAWAAKEKREAAKPAAMAPPKRRQAAKHAAALAKLEEQLRGLLAAIVADGLEIGSPGYSGTTAPHIDAARYEVRLASAARNVVTQSIDASAERKREVIDAVERDALIEAVVADADGIKKSLALLRSTLETVVGRQG